jgi:membrane associated rhomboid family serine protease/Flp pilus assembly protein TadD
MKQLSKGEIRLAASRTTIGIILINLLVFVIMIIVAGSSALLAPTPVTLLNFGANFAPYTLGLGQHWRILSAGFVHQGIIHLTLNVWALVVVSSMLEELVSTRRYLIVFVLSILGGSVASILWDPAVITCGASGGVFGVLGCYASCAWWRKKLTNDGKTHFSGRKALAIILYCILLGVLTPGSDNANHVGGLLAGVLLGIWCASPSVNSAITRYAVHGVPYLVCIVMAGFFVWEVMALASSPSLQSLLDKQQASNMAAMHHNHDALRLIDRAILRTPGDISLYAVRAPILVELEAFEKAREDCNVVLSKDRDNQIMLLTRSIANHNLGDDGKSVDDLTRLIKLNPKQALAYNNRAWSLAAQKKYDLALADCDQALSLNPRLATAYDTKAVVLGCMRQYAQALKCANEAIAIKKDDGAFYHHRSVILAALGSLAEAKADSAKAAQFEYQQEEWENDLKQGLNK